MYVFCSGDRLLVESFSKGEHSKLFALLNSLEPNDSLPEIIVTGVNAKVFKDEIEKATNTR